MTTSSSVARDSQSPLKRSPTLVTTSELQNLPPLPPGDFESAAQVFFMRNTKELVVMDNFYVGVLNLSSVSSGWRILGAPPRRVNGAAAVLLPDETVVVAEGDDLSAPLQFAVTDGWRQLDAVVEKLEDSCALFSAEDEEIIVTGGFRAEDGGGGLKSAVTAMAVHDGQISGRIALPELNEARRLHTCSLVTYEGKRGIIVAGGSGGGGAALSSVEFLAYPGGFHWQRLPSLPYTVLHGKMENVHNKVYVFGGGGVVARTTNTALLSFDNSTGSWNRVGIVPTDKRGHGVAVVSVC